MSDDELTPERAAALTAAVDIEAPPPDGEPVALVLFGTNQAASAQIAAARYHAGAAPLVIATGGVNRHNGIVEGREFARQLTGAGVPGDVIRVEDQSKDTWQNVELSLPYLREALALGLRLAVVSKWYHLRTVYCLATLLPEAAPFYAISWEPVYAAGTLVTRASWPKIPDGRRRVLRESQEVPRRVADGTYRAANKANGAWQLSWCPCLVSCAIGSEPRIGRTTDLDGSVLAARTFTVAGARLPSDLSHFVVVVRLVVSVVTQTGVPSRATRLRSPRTFAMASGLPGRRRNGRRQRPERRRSAPSGARVRGGRDGQDASSLAASHRVVASSLPAWAVTSPKRPARRATWRPATGPSRATWR